MSDNKTADGGVGPPPAQPLAPGNFDKAWNDPPLFSYSAASASGQTGAGANRLNKRVAFPSQPSAVPSGGEDPTAPPKLYDAGMKPQGSASHLPPPPPSCLPPPAVSHSQPCSESESPPVSSDSVQETFLQTIEKYVESNSQEEVKARLGGLFRDWTSLNSDIQQALRLIAESLDREDLGMAEANFTTLSADWSSVIGPSNVMVIKKILYAARQALLSAKEDEAVTKPL